MPTVADIRDVVDYLTMLKIPYARNARPLPARIIGGIYDSLISPLSTQSAANRFLNYGYWRSDTRDERSASIALMDELLSRIPTRSGRLLDIACGTGATTRYVCRYWNPHATVGINISRRQLAIAPADSLCGDFAVMDAVSPAFRDHSFQTIICVEAAFHFNSREAFLRSALRLLTTRGVLAVTDVLLWRDGHALLPMWLECNYVPTLADYSRLLNRVGFRNIELVDITEQGWRSWLRNRVASIYDDWLSERIDFRALQLKLQGLYRLAAAIRFNVLCVAVK